MFVTVIWNVAVPPLETVWASGSFTIEIAGGSGGSGGTLTRRRRVVRRTSGPAAAADGGGDVRERRRHVVRKHVYVTEAAGAIVASAGSCALVRLQPGASASVTRTFVSVTCPSFVTTIVQVAAVPLWTS